MATTVADRITVDPAVMVDKPVIAGTRMPVELIMAKPAANPVLDECFLDYPDLTVDDVKARLRYASVVVSRTEYAGDDELCLKVVYDAKEPQESPWLRGLYDYFAPVRQESLIAVSRTRRSTPISTLLSPRSVRSGALTGHAR